MEDKTYTKTYYCSNCSRSFTAVFKFGEVAHQPECPHCGVAPDRVNKFWYNDNKYFVKDNESKAEMNLARLL